MSRFVWMLFIALCAAPVFAAPPSFARLNALGDSLTINTQGGFQSDKRTQPRGWVNILAQQMGTTLRLPLLEPMNIIGQQKRSDYPNYQHHDVFAYNGVSTDDTFQKFGSTPGFLGLTYEGIDLIMADRPGYSLVTGLVANDPTFVVGFMGSNDFMSAVMATGTMLEGIPTFGIKDEIDPLDATGLRPQNLFRSDFETMISMIYKPGRGMCFGTLPELPNIPGILDKEELTAFIGPNSLPEDCVTSYTVAAGVHGGLKTGTIFADDRNFYTPAEMQIINEAIHGYNNSIREIAADPAHPFAVAETPIQAPEVVQGTAHVNGWRINNDLFYFSLGKPAASIMTTDGVHMSDIGNAYCAQVYIRTINAYYGTNIPELTEAQLTQILNNDRWVDNDADGKIEGLSADLAFVSLNFVYPNETGDSNEVPRNAKLLNATASPGDCGTVQLSQPGPENWEGSSVTLTAIPTGDPVGEFLRWEGDVPGGVSFANPLTVTMDTHKNITAVFGCATPEGEGGPEGEGQLEGTSEGASDGEGSPEPSCQEGSLLAQLPELGNSYAHSDAAWGIRRFDDIYSTQALEITAIRWWGLSDSPASHCDAGPFTVGYYTQGTSPAFLLQQEVEVTPTIQHAGPGGDAEFPYVYAFDAMLPQPLRLAPGYNLISIFAPQPANGCHFLWLNASSGNAQSFGISLPSGEDFIEGSDFAFCLTGSIVFAEGEGTPEGIAEGVEEGEGAPDGGVEGNPEGTPDGSHEGALDGALEGILEGAPEGNPEGGLEGVDEGEGAPDGAAEGEPEGIQEGVADGEGAPEGIVEGEGTPEGQPEGAPEGVEEGVQDPDPSHHSADVDANNVLSLSEVLRVVQFFNLGGISCATGGSEDGYLPGAGLKLCAPYDGDFSPRDWIISISELLRMIQLYNAGGYRHCPGENNEDGFCAV